MRRVAGWKIPSNRPTLTPTLTPTHPHPSPSPTSTQERVHQLDHRLADDVRTPLRHVRTPFLALTLTLTLTLALTAPRFSTCAPGSTLLHL